MGDLGTSVLSSPRITLPGSGLLTGDLGTFVLSYSRLPPPPNLEFSWRTVNGTGLWRLITVSNVDNILSVIEGRACTRFTQK